MLRKKNEQGCDLSSEQMADECVNDPHCRQIFISKVVEDVEDALEATLVEAIKQANERPPLWWQWLLLFIFGALAGVGLGIVIAAKSGIVQPAAPPLP